MQIKSFDGTKYTLDVPVEKTKEVEYTRSFVAGKIASLPTRIAEYQERVTKLQAQLDEYEEILALMDSYQ